MKTNKKQFTMRYYIEKLNYKLVKIEYDSLISAKVQDIKHDRAVQWHCAKRVDFAEAHFWAEAPEVIP